MDKVYRDKPDIFVAINTAACRRLALHWTKPASHASNDISNSDAEVEDFAQARPAPRSLSQTLRLALRAPMRIVYQIVKPALRPLLFRMRRYLTFEIHSQLERYHAADKQAIERASADILRETQASREQLRHELLGAQQQALTTQRMQFEQRIDVMEAASPQRILHLFDRMIDAQNEALLQQNRYFDERLEAKEATSPQRILHLFDQMIAAQNETLLQQNRYFDQQLEAIESRSSQRFLSMLESMITAHKEMLLEQTVHYEQRLIQWEDKQRVAEKLKLEQVNARFDRIENYSYASARRVTIASGEGRTLIKTEAGYVVCPSDDLAVVALLTESGDLERGTRKLISKLVGPGDCYVDVGANLGLHTIAAGRAMEHRGTIVAFEPFPRTLELLKETLHINGLRAITTLHQMAVSDRAGRHAFYLGNTCGHHSLFALSGSDASNLQPIEVATVRLDDILPRDTVVTLIKVDAEGAELDVLHGAVAILSSNTNIGLIVEFGISHLNRNSISTSSWLGEFTKLGFIFRAIDPDSGALMQWTPEALEAVDSINLLFARPESPLWQKASVE